MLAQLKARLSPSGVAWPDTNDDAAMTNALSVASRDLEGALGRQFNTTTGAGSGSGVTYGATSITDTAGTFVAPQVGLVVTSAAITGTITALTSPTTLAIAPGSTGGCPA